MVTSGPDLLREVLVSEAERLGPPRDLLAGVRAARARRRRRVTSLAAVAVLLGGAVTAPLLINGSVRTDRLAAGQPSAVAQWEPRGSLLQDEGVQRRVARAWSRSDAVSGEHSLLFAERVGDLVVTAAVGQQEMGRSTAVVFFVGPPTEATELVETDVRVPDADAVQVSTYIPAAGAREVVDSFALDGSPARLVVLGGPEATDVSLVTSRPSVPAGVRELARLSKGVAVMDVPDTAYAVGLEVHASPDGTRLLWAGPPASGLPGLGQDQGDGGTQSAFPMVVDEGMAPRTGGGARRFLLRAYPQGQEVCVGVRVVGSGGSGESCMRTLDGSALNAGNGGLGTGEFFVEGVVDPAADEVRLVLNDGTVMTQPAVAVPGGSLKVFAIAVPQGRRPVRVDAWASGRPLPRGQQAIDTSWFDSCEGAPPGAAPPSCSSTGTPPNVVGDADGTGGAERDMPGQNRPATPGPSSCPNSPVYAEPIDPGVKVEAICD